MSNIISEEKNNETQSVSINSELSAEVSDSPKKKNLFSRIMTPIFIICFISIAAFFIYQYKSGKFDNWKTFREYVNSFGWGGPIFLTVFQCLKVPYVFIAGGFGCAAGGALFGAVKGFICNYIGITSGSILTFFISKKYGPSLVRSIFSEKKYNSYVNWMSKYKKHYTLFLWIAICSPIAPDDFLCYFSGASGMSNRRFLIIITTAKIWSILGYSIIFGRLAG